MSRMVDVDEVKKCLEEVSGDDKTDAIALLEWAIDKRTVQAVPIEVLQEIRQEIANLVKLYPFIDHKDTYVKESEVLEIIDKHLDKLK